MVHKREEKEMLFLSVCLTSFTPQHNECKEVVSFFRWRRFRCCEPTKWNQNSEHTNFGDRCRAISRSILPNCTCCCRLALRPTSVKNFIDDAKPKKQLQSRLIMLICKFERFSLRTHTINLMRRNFFFLRFVYVVYALSSLSLALESTLMINCPITHLNVNKLLVICICKMQLMKCWVLYALFWPFVVFVRHKSQAHCDAPRTDERKR